ncbi:ethanolamine utilization protein EutJ [Tessaracoccus massiliensis]|uniref:ethanolamine utilization protein EutJ n=1 Tax=Tessaracoccus massiliensis TaxID=1522311 RepID=UPI00059047F7|nr:ethanolamine utilization protein EutJ [Tessaracoccus massiliensis]
MSTTRPPIDRFARLVRTGQVDAGKPPLRLGVDLGTANIVLALVDGGNRPVAGAWRQAGVVRDGVIVDWHGAVTCLKEIVDEIRARLGTDLPRSAAVAIPPGIDAGTTKVFTNVLEAAGLTPEEVVDEPVAAATALGVTDGAVIDIGHGTTGVSVIRDSQLVHSIDEATGGHHMTLVISGALGVPYERAERLKRSPGQRDTVAGLIRPTLEKMATIAAEGLRGHQVEQIHLVGGSSSFPIAPAVFSDVLGQPVHRPTHPLFPTPLGVAMRRTT